MFASFKEIRKYTFSAKGVASLMLHDMYRESVIRELHMHREKLSTTSNNRLRVQTPSPIQKLRIECGHLNMHTSSSTQVHGAENRFSGTDLA